MKRWNRRSAIKVNNMIMIIMIIKQTLLADVMSPAAFSLSVFLGGAVLMQEISLRLLSP